MSLGIDCLLLLFFLVLSLLDLIDYYYCLVLDLIDYYYCLVLCLCYILVMILLVLKSTRYNPHLLTNTIPNPSDISSIIDTE